MLPLTPTSAPLPATATPTPIPTPPSATPIPPPPAPTQRPPSPPQPQTQTHSTASSRPSQASEHGPDSAARRKVAFRSPPPTPGTIPVPLPEPESEQIQIPPPPPAQSPSHSQSQPQTTTTTYYRMRPNSATARFREGSSTPPKINTSGRTTAASGRVTHSPTQSTRTYPNEAASMTIRSGTPYSHMSGTSAIQAAASWSEAAENDLVSNLGSRERTRQEVLWEIVASEERYVGELIKLKETFLDSLLHPFAAVPPASTLYHPAETSTILDEERASLRRAASPVESIDHLPIAARFLSPTPGPASSSTHHTRAETPRSKYRAPTIDEAEDSYDSDDEGKFPSRRRQPSGGKSPYGTTAQRRTGSGKVPVPFPARSHQSLPPQQTRNYTAAASSHSLGRQSVAPDSADRKGASALKQRFQRRAGSRDMPAGVLGLGITAQQLPEDLRICLEVLEEVILPGHLTLREGLQKRYEEQYPLVRSLADIFVAHSHILRGYAKYVLHLERALEQVDNALSATNVTKRPRNQNAAQWAQVCKALQRLEEVAADKCETGLAISLSKPFQRLLKYPLLFQNLLFQTDPSTHEYESTLEMVAEVERIVRSIEDEKTQKEERDRTWDVFARIEGLEKIKQLAVPKPSRLLVNERPLHPDPTAPDTNRTVAGPPASTPTKNIRGKSSLRRISDALQSGSSGKKDLWLVSFNDVVLRCQRTGVTTMPLVSGSTADKLPATNGSGKGATVGRRAQVVKPRNLYKFIKIETWTIGDVSRPRAGVVSMEDITKTRTGVSIEDMALHNRAPIQEDDDEDEGAESDESDRKSKMSFSYWGADRITVQPTARGPGGARVPVRRIPGAQAAYLRDARTESSANAKFGTRLRESSTPERPTSRTGAGSRTGTRRSESTRPAWGTMTPIPGSRRGSASLTPATVPVASSSTPTRKSTVSASPAPSVDSGIAVYLAQDRS
ncbi:RhoGEF domain-containing protein gxcJ [Dictyostelium discoideum] [Rhizoctonia solani]|uniref:RhoGEF domain-containing protein gxcJ [Dictyostelium discoideum] n=1 Tax=Rhizoctonia solani TaxID=456999 RepID=A0A0K6G1L9_9AGAM|nr:RhoGEF domain-containing protein gxcJ [Dictyostelium discoideum] [Rhizoctonia solani]